MYKRQLLKVAKAEAIDLTPDGADLLARMANGALRDALSLLDQCRAAGAVVDGRRVLDTLGLAGSTQTVQLMRLLLARQGGDALALLDQLYREAKVESVEYGETVDVVAVCTPRIIGQLKDYIEGWTEPKEEWE